MDRQAATADAAGAGRAGGQLAGLSQEVSVPAMSGDGRDAAGASHEAVTPPTLAGARAAPSQRGATTGEGSAGSITPGMTGCGSRRSATAAHSAPHGPGKTMPRPV